jgi:hypothetical protein
MHEKHNNLLIESMELQTKCSPQVQKESIIREISRDQS